MIFIINPLSYDVVTMKIPFHAIICTMTIVYIAYSFIESFSCAVMFTPVVVLQCFFMYVYAGRGKHTARSFAARSPKPGCLTALTDLSLSENNYKALRTRLSAWRF